ncbi:hypothetical protein [Pasteurella multocida]|nr:hypothetical protein [Pasteurella multocida]WNY75896.1 hypothetical protein H2513_08400 [Pasteurella multocida]
MKKAIIKLTTVFGLSCLLIACGGGGGGGGSGNGGNNAPPPVQPIQPAPPAHQQPDAAPNIPAPPKNQAPDNGAKEAPPAPPAPPANDSMGMSPPPSTQEKWEGACVAKSFCTAQNKNNVTVYNLKYVENADRLSGTPDKYTKQEEHITLKLGDNAKEEYKFTLLGTEGNEVGYYGYRHNVDDNRAHKNVELLYAINADFKHETQPSQLRAYYRKEKGFIYAPISNNQLSNNSLVNYGDVDLIYDEGKVSGSIYRSNNGDPSQLNKEKIFSIETKNSDKPSIEPIVNDLLGVIKQGDKAVLNYILADSEKGKDDHKYLFGSAKAETWIGVLAAEKSNEKPAEKQANK